jgi:hypothetical protein
VAVIIGMVLVVFYFPKKQAEDELRAAFLVSDEGERSSGPIPTAGGEVLPPGPPMAGGEGEAAPARGLETKPGGEG